VLDQSLDEQRGESCQSTHIDGKQHVLKHPGTRSVYIEFIRTFDEVLVVIEQTRDDMKQNRNAAKAIQIVEVIVPERSVHKPHQKAKASASLPRSAGA
jgi:hypothetical protein